MFGIGEGFGPVLGGEAGQLAFVRFLHPLTRARPKATGRSVADLLAEEQCQGGQALAVSDGSDRMRAGQPA